MFHKNVFSLPIDSRIWRNNNPNSERWSPDIKDFYRDEYPKLQLLIDKWTKDIAHKWAYQRFRNTYVPYELQNSISKEGEHQYEELRAEYSSQELSQEYYDSLPF